MSETTKQRSLDKLFGKDRVVRKAPEGAPSDERGTGVAQSDAASGGASAPPSRSKRAESAASSAPAARAGSSRASAGRRVATSPAEKPVEGPGGYLGKGRYRRGDGVLEKSSVYLRPDQVQALRVAAATKGDPHGATMSEIIQSLLDQHGYCDPEQRKG